MNKNLPIASISLEESSRAGVFAVCLCFLFSIALHFPNLPLWVSLIVVLSLAWRGMQTLGRIRPVPRLALVTLVLFGGVGVFAEYWTIVGRDAGLALLTVMTAFKFLESRSHRDMLILVFLCYFLIATHFLFSQSIFTAVMMLATLVVITATLLTLNQRDDSVPIRQRLASSARMIGLSIPLMLILFVLVPRVPGPLWGLQSEQRGGVTGLSDYLEPGRISNLIRSNEVAFRVDFDGEIPPQNQLYWRGPVMSAYNGYRWTQAPRQTLQRFQVRKAAPLVKYTVTLEPNGERWLLALDIPTRLIEDSVMTRDFQLTSKTRINELKRYQMESRLDFQVGLEESERYLDITRSYPEIRNPRSIALGKSLAAQHDSAEAIIGAALTMFSRENFVYTLRPPLLGEHSVDEFLFETRRGFCENYAGAFALLMRAAGLPTRIVAGYQGGEFNRVGNYLIVRQSDAHAWTEVWIEDRGWLRIDPTAAVSPSRIEQGLDEALPNETAGFRIQKRNPLFGNLLYSWDNLQHGWNDWVLNYDHRKQQNFLSRLEVGIESWSDMVFALVILLLSVTGLFWGVSWYHERPPRPPVYERQLARLQRKLDKHGFQRRPAEDTRAFLERIRGTGDYPQTDRIAGIIELYNQVKYGRGDFDPDSLRRLRELVSAID